MERYGSWDEKPPKVEVPVKTDNRKFKIKQVMRITKAEEIVTRRMINNLRHSGDKNPVLEENTTNPEEIIFGEDILNLIDYYQKGPKKDQLIDLLKYGETKE